MAVGAPGPAGGEARRGGPVNLNTADAAALETLPGVGPATAAAIIEHRQEVGGFTSVDELLDVPGHRRRQARAAARPGDGVIASDRAAVALAVAAVARRAAPERERRSAAGWCWPAPRWRAALAVGRWWWRRRWWSAGWPSAASTGSTAWSEAPFAGEVVLLGDPEPSFGGLRVDVRVGGRRLEARAERHGGRRAGAAAGR